MLTAMDSARIVAEARAGAGLSIRALARAAQVSPSTVHRIEQGRLVPTVEMLDRLVRAAGRRLEVTVRPDQRTITGLAQTIEADLDRDPDDCTVPVRRAVRVRRSFRPRRSVDPAQHDPLPASADRRCALGCVSRRSGRVARRSTRSRRSRVGPRPVAISRPRMVGHHDAVPARVGVRREPGFVPGPRRVFAP